MTSTTRHETQIVSDPDVPLVRIVREFDAPPEKVFRAHTDPELVAQWLGPRNLTMNELAAMAQQDLSTARTPKHVPRAALHVLAASHLVGNSAMSRQANAALIMDTIDMTVDRDHGPDI